MPSIVFNYTAPTSAGTATTITQRVVFPVRPPGGSRYTIRQVSATSPSTSFTDAFKMVNIYIPELMDGYHTTFQDYTISSGQLVATTPSYKGIKYFLSESTGQPFAMNLFPHFNLGRQSIDQQYLTLQFTPLSASNTLASIYSYSVVIEWDTS